MVSGGETIVAPVTAPGHAGVSVVRVSGPQAQVALEALARNGAIAARSPRTMVFTAIGPKHAPLDHGMVVFFPGPASFTGEDCAEFHLHGSPFLLARILELVVAHGARHARPGEFTERAFHNGKIDLAQAEAIADLIAAETELQARCAREQLEGRLSHAIAEIGDPLRNFLAEMEAYIDFPDEDIEPLTIARWGEALNEVAATLRRYIASFASGRLCREGARVVLAGLPNAGKSSMLNALLGEDRAIVTDIPGTTRDSIEERLTLDGLAVRLCDTAGLLSEEAARTPDLVEQMGISRSWERLTNADLVLYLSDVRDPIGPEEETIFARVKTRARRVVVLLTKLDLVDPATAAAAKAKVATATGCEVLLCSARQAAALDKLRTALRALLLGNVAEVGSIVITTERHVHALREASAAVNEALAALDANDPAEFVAVHVRAALGALNEIIGVTHNDDILGRIFSKFCIGK